MKKTFFTLGCLTLLALIVRLFLIQYYQCIDTDGVSYVSIAKELFEKHRLLDRFYPPFYPFLLGLTSYMFNNYELAGRFVSAVLGALLVIPTYFLGKEIYGKKTGVIASIFVIIHPGLTDYSARVLTESTSTFFLTLFLLVSIHAIKSSKWWLYVISGFLIGISYLTRPEALGFLPYFIGASITIVLFGKAGDPKNLIKNLVFFFWLR